MRPPIGRRSTAIVSMEADSSDDEEGYNEHCAIVIRDDSSVEEEDVIDLVSSSEDDDDEEEDDEMEVEVVEVAAGQHKLGFAVDANVEATEQQKQSEEATVTPERGEEERPEPGNTSVLKATHGQDFEVAGTPKNPSESREQIQDLVIIDDDDEEQEDSIARQKDESESTKTPGNDGNLELKEATATDLESAEKPGQDGHNDWKETAVTNATSISESDQASEVQGPEVISESDQASEVHCPEVISESDQASELQDPEGSLDGGDQELAQVEGKGGETTSVKDGGKEPGSTENPSATNDGSSEHLESDRKAAASSPRRQRRTATKIAGGIWKPEGRQRRRPTKMTGSYKPESSDEAEPDDFVDDKKVAAAATVISSKAEGSVEPTAENRERLLENGKGNLGKADTIMVSSESEDSVDPTVENFECLENGDGNKARSMEDEGTAQPTSDTSDKAHREEPPEDKETTPLTSDTSDEAQCEESPENGEQDPSTKRGRSKTAETRMITRRQGARPKQDESTGRQAIKSLVRKDATAKKSTAKKSKPKGNANKTPIKIGDRVYAQWFDSKWFWATVKDIEFKSKPHLHEYFLYFDDGDVSRHQSGCFKTVAQYREIYGEEPPPAPAQEQDSETEGDASMTRENPHGTAMGCGKCSNCLKNKCGRCAKCREGAGKQHCFQKMCIELPVEEKAQPAAGFPSGWRFYFGENRRFNSSKYKLIPNLWLLSPGNKSFRSVEAAASVTSVLSSGLDVERLFYEHVGLSDALQLMTATAGQSSTSLQIPREKQELALRKSARPSESQSSTLQPNGCAERSLSTRKDIGAHVFFKRVGFECWGIIVRKTRKSGSGNIRYTIQLDDDKTEIDDITVGHIVTEATYKSQTNKDPPPPPEHEIQLDSTEDSSTERKCKRQKTEIGNLIIGKKCCFTWKDLNGNNKMVHGFVAEYKNGTCLVQFSSKSREVINSIGNDCGLELPSSRMLPLPLVVGGCVLYAKQMGESISSIIPSNAGPDLEYFWDWISPDMRYEQTVVQSEGHCLPRLILVVRNFQLEFNVRPSTVPGAGYGIFLKVTRLVEDGNDAPFELKPGELVDMGVYGPRRRQDRKLKEVLYAKHFVLGYNSETWSFNSIDDDYEFDMTNEPDGELHSLAANQIHAYVNECSSYTNASVRPQHSPDGFVHYLLGHADMSQGSFVLELGHDTEIFTHYGEGYEKNRVRQGYSFLPKNKQQRWQNYILDEDLTCVRTIDQFKLVKVDACVKHFDALFATEDKSKFTTVAVERALVCAAVLQRRAFRYSVARPDLPVDDTLADAERLVSRLLNMVEASADLKELQIQEEHDKVLQKLLRTMFTDKDIQAFNKGPIYTSAE